MAIRKITSDPKPSVRHQGWLYSYYSKPTANGGECAVIFPPSIADIVRKGFAFDDSCVFFDENLRASVLALDFDMEEPEPTEDPGSSVDFDAEAGGWSDPDRFTASAAPQEQQRQHRPGVRPAAVRKRQAQLNTSGAQLPPEMLQAAIHMSRLFLVIYAQLGSSVPETSKAMIAQKLAACVAIPYYRSKGIDLTEEDAQSISMS